MSTIARHLKNLGHSVTFYTSETYRAQAESTGARFVAMPGKANINFRPTDSEGTPLCGDDQRVHLMKTVLAETVADQYWGIQQILRVRPVDLVLADTMFFGHFPVLLGPKQKRPPVIGCGVNPIMLHSCDCLRTSPPDTTPAGQRRNREENQRVEAKFQQVTNRMNEVMRHCGASPLPHFFMDCMYRLPDLFLQFTAETFEFPRSDMPETLRFAGALLPTQSVQFEEPAWWSELDSDRPVVLVTQGTFANQEFNELIQPTLSGLADENVTVIVAAGRSDTHTLAIPANARVASFVPFDRLLPKVDVFITNGGYGAVNHAFSLGVPIVVAGETEDKDFVAARVGWTGAGINLKTRYPSAEQIRTAVRTILTDKQYRQEARRLRADFARYNALDEVTRAVNTMLAHDESMALSSSVTV
jgi:MGT family glycosyltransferase